MTSRSKFLPATLVLGAAAYLAACGGGDGGGASPAPASTPLAISGVAASGAAIAGQTVSVKCAAGTGGTVTQANGSFSVSIASGVLPCVLAVTSSGVTLHSFAVGSGASATANLTPLTELVVAALAKADTSTYFAGFDAASAANVSSANIDLATAWVRDVLTGAGLNLTAAGNWLTAALTAASGSTRGDAHDQVLDALAAALATSGHSLPTLSRTVANTLAGTASGNPALSAQLPAEALLKPHAASCPSLTSGTYRLVSPYPNAPSLDSQTTTIPINATTLSLTLHGVAAVLSPVASDPCHFTIPGTPAGEVVVSPSGMVIIRYVTGGVYSVATAFPEQTHTLAELAGIWDAIGLNRNAGNTGYNGVSATLTMDANGTQSNVSWCENAATRSVAGCTVLTGEQPRFAVNANGGFDVSMGGNVTSRAFAYRAGNGALMVVKVDSNGSSQVRGQHGTLTAQLESPYSIWNIDINTAGQAPGAAYLRQWTSTSVDTAAQTLTRLSGTDGHTETLNFNVPRAGFVYRAAGTAPGTNGTVPINEFTALGRIRRNFGVSVNWFPGLGLAGALGTLEFSVVRP